MSEKQIPTFKQAPASHGVPIGNPMQDATGLQPPMRHAPLEQRVPSASNPTTLQVFIVHEPILHSPASHLIPFSTPVHVADGVTIVEEVDGTTEDVDVKSMHIRSLVAVGTATSYCIGPHVLI